MKNIKKVREATWQSSIQVKILFLILSLDQIRGPSSWIRFKLCLDLNYSRYHLSTQALKRQSNIMQAFKTSARSQTCRRRRPSIAIIRKITNNHADDDVMTESKLVYKLIRENHYEEMQRVKCHNSVI